MYGLSSGTSTPGRAVVVDQFHLDARRAQFGQHRLQAGGDLRGSWLGTRRKLNFAPAVAGSTVLAPSPW